MIHLSIRNFRCWTTLDLELRVGSFNLIKGVSGSGKTTLFQSIAWCLYGNLRLVSPIWAEKAKTMVSLSFPHVFKGKMGQLKLIRYKHPNRLSLEHDDSYYEDEVAQKLIDQIFGTYDLWLASCYIGQGCRNSFLVSSQVGRMEFLNSLVFHAEDPSLYLDRVTSLLLETNKEYDLKLAHYLKNLEKMKEMMEILDLDRAAELSSLEMMRQEQEVIQEKIVALNLVKNQREIDTSLLRNFEEQLEHLRLSGPGLAPVLKEGVIEGIRKCHFDPDDELGDVSRRADEVDLGGTITRITSILPSLQHRDLLYRNFLEIPNPQGHFTSFREDEFYTHQDYLDTCLKEKALKDQRELAQSLGVSYHQDEIEKTILSYQQILETQKSLPLREQLTREKEAIQQEIYKLTNQHQSLLVPIKLLLIPPELLIPHEIKVLDESRFETASLKASLHLCFQEQGRTQSTIAILEKNQDILSCPSCQVPVRYHGNQLCLAGAEPVSHQELSREKENLRLITQQIRATEGQIKDLENLKSLALRSIEQAKEKERSRNLRIQNLENENARLIFEQSRRDQERIKVELNLRDLESKIITITQEIEEHQRIHGLMTGGKILSSDEIKNLHLTLGKLMTLVVLEEPSPSSAHRLNWLNYQEIKQLYQKRHQEYHDFLITLGFPFRELTTLEVQATLRALETYQRDLFSYRERMEQHQTLLNSLEERADKLRSNLAPDPEPEIRDLGSEVSQLTSDLRLKEENDQFLDFHATVTQEREEVTQLNNRLSHLQILKQHIAETECHLLQEVVDGINTSVNGICETLFDRNITITLGLFKTTKVSKNTKPSVNFTISYQGGKFDNINQMSGGEGDRASIALTLALNRLSACPLIMLDESLDSLDLDMKETTIQTIRETTEATVLVIDYGMPEGYFDRVIDVDLLK
jgi:DNA repair exonuclease SbcCD ATPase subunit